MSESLKLDPKKTALVLIDLQHGIVSRDTKPYLASDVVIRARTLAGTFRQKGAPVIYVHVDLQNIRRPPSDEAPQVPVDIPAEASDIVPGAGKQPGDVLITKRHWGAFAQTHLEQELHSRGVETVVLAGIATNLGVESTLRQGTGLGFGFVVVEDVCSTFSSEMQTFAFQNIFPRISRVRTMQQVQDALA